MRLLLDTHIFLWYITGDERVSGSIREAIENSEIAYLSVISLWEAMIKYQLGKLPLPEPPNPWLREQREHHGIDSLGLDEASVSRLPTLPSHHRDPFDRMLVCQAMEHDLQIVTVDPVIARYPAAIFQSA